MLPKCQIREFNIEVKKKTEVVWASNWTSSFYLEPHSASHEVSEEFLSYDVGALIGDVGGFLGLFLGWSLLSLFGSLSNTMSRIFFSIITKKDKIIDESNNK